MNVRSTDVMDVINERFNFEVNKLPLTGPENLRTPYKGLFRSDTGECIGRTSVGSDYQVHTNYQVAELVRGAIGLFNDEVELDCHFRDGHYVTIKPTIEERHEVYGTKDNIFPVVMLRAGYNQTPVEFGMFAKRDACENMVLLQTIEDAVYRILHRKSLDFKVDQLVTDLTCLKKGWEGVKQAADRMQAREVLLDDFLKSIYGEPTEGATSRSASIHHKRTTDIMNRVIDERRRTGRPEFEVGNYAVSAWEAYNAVQGFQQHLATRKKINGNKATRFDRIVLAAKDRYVQQAEVLALAG